MLEEKLYQIEELPDLKVNWTESYKCLNEPLLEYVWEVANHFLPDYAETDIVLFLIFRIGLIKSAVLSSGLFPGHLPIASEGFSYKMAMPVPFRISPCLSRPEIRRTSVSAI